MSDEMPNGETQADSTEARKLRRTGQTCITLAVVFAISLASFGKPPLVRTGDAMNSRVDFNLISCIGVAMAVFGVLFVLTHVRRILRLSTVKRVLGLIGCLGLTVHAVFALFMPLTYEPDVPPAVGTGGNQPFARCGPEQWVIEGKTWHIASTYLLQLREGLQFTIEYPYRFTDAPGTMDDERALAIVFPLMKHTYTSGRYKRAGFTKIGQGHVTPSRIGVVLFEKVNGKAHGYRVGLSLAQIRERIAQTNAADVPVPSKTADNSP